MKVVFILKLREDYSNELHYTKSLSTGLYNSARFVHEMMIDSGFDSRIEIAQDANSIDRILTETKADVCILEALWVPPTKITELENLHPSVKFIVRLHSETPFIAGEGIAMDWISEYLNMKNVIIAPNSKRIMRELEGIYEHKNIKDKLIFLPNYYPINFIKHSKKQKSDEIHISCFGAIRPLKNNLIQAFAAIEIANRLNKKLRFHINYNRIEGGAQPVIKNIIKLFENLSDTGHEIILHEWMDHSKFIDLCSTMDLGLQVSFSETFNIVSADLISNGVPIVGSKKELPWSVDCFNANPVDYISIVDKSLLSIKRSKCNVFFNQMKLKWYAKRTNKIWKKYFGGLNA
jgi:hypothetical protein